ncbi:MAG TPA: non-heme iron oxygenase ferredoxin subunit [Myxococcales bacterium]|nr:non-heme iron oxygenase ferredoxin subunit [Myxococcales bacterium]HIK85500.1 non-heme iron oxygenase ferredoxin subunit [Myxococcales bacterium]
MIESEKRRVPYRALSNGQMIVVDVEGEAILVCRVEGRYHALRDLCSHADQALSEGRLRGHTIYCPLHGSRFDVRTGECLSPPATFSVKRFLVEESDEGLFVSRAREED